ncbi:hypothetical protein [Mesorhizobium sp. ANAO-SY3R2]|uniref:hypothetical protein n=1 Tax=Mesorhizobium sp. ANAO-SY3R2 TaxID=3166644 RepID=UPI00366E6A96
MTASIMERVNFLATRGNLAPETRKRKPRQVIDGPWEMSGPEEGDGDDTVLVCNTDATQYEVIRITQGTLAKRKQIARRIAELLNEGKAEIE